MNPSERIRLVCFLKEHLGKLAPTFWDGEALIPAYPFDIKIRESSLESWVWEAAFEYRGDELHTVQTNSFSDQFAYEILSTLDELAFTLKDEWDDKAEEVINYVSHEFNIVLEKNGDPYEKYDESSPYYGKEFSKWAWAHYEGSDAFPIVQSAIILNVFEDSEPVLVLESERLDVRYVYSLTPDDDGYPDIIQNFIEATSS